MTEQSPHNETQSTETPYPWHEFGRVGKIQGWVEELKKAKDSHLTAQDWHLLGRAVMICHPVEELRTTLVKKIAHEAGFGYIGMTGVQFFEGVMEGTPIPDSCPLMIHVEQGVWSRKIEDNPKAAEELVNFQTKDLPKYFAELPDDLVVIFIVTGESYTDLQPSLRTVGSFDRRFDVADLTLADLGAWFLNLLGVEQCDETLTADTGRVGKLINDEFDDRRRQRLISLHLQRLAHREKRKLCFDDLVYFAVHGGAETEHPPEDDPTSLYRIAVHEAGHALVSIIDSNGRNMPDYTSIIPGGHFKGVVADSYAYSYALSGRYTYEDSRHKIRIQLAGRVAEAIEFGATNVSTFGARSDLRNATSWAKELVGICGFSAEQENPDAIRDNLAVIDDEPSASEAAHIEFQTRLLLKRQYEAVERMILRNRPLLDAITNALLEHRILNQVELTKLWELSQQVNNAQTPSDILPNFRVMNPIMVELEDLIKGKEETETLGLRKEDICSLSNVNREKLLSAIQKHVFMNNRGIAFFSLSQSPWEYTANILAMFAFLTLSELFYGNLPDNEFRRLCDSMLRFVDAPIYFDNTDGLAIGDRLLGIDCVRRMIHPKSLGAIICDRASIIDKKLLDYCARESIEVILLDH